MHRLDSVASGLLLLFVALVGCLGTPTRVPPPQQPSAGPMNCSPGQQWCNGDCRDPGFFTADNQNCGRCGNSCNSISESCTGGSCGCAPGYVSCMGSCVSSISFMSDTNNCGGCGHSCSAGESCTGGFCRKTLGELDAGNASIGSAARVSARDLIAAGAAARCSSVLSTLAPFCATSPATVPANETANLKRDWNKAY